MARRGEPQAINQALNRPRAKLGLDLTAWMAITFVCIAVFRRTGGVIGQLHAWQQGECHEREPLQTLEQNNGNWVGKG